MEGEAVVRDGSFEVGWSVAPRGEEEGRIILRGNLKNNRETREKLYRNLECMPRQLQFDTFLVDASEAHVSEGGEEVWIEAAHCFLFFCTLNYVPSELALILRRDRGRRYRHLYSHHKESGVAVAPF